MTPTEDPIAAAPDKQGAHGRAWRVDLAAWRADGAIVADSSAPLNAWVIEASGAHPIWHSYFLTLIHLRPIAGFPSPRLYRPDATHELVLLALDPDAPREAMLTRGNVRYLLPANFMAQLVEANDAAAVARAEDAVDRIVAGTLNPDTDAIRQWVALFGGYGLRSDCI